MTTHYEISHRCGHTEDRDLAHKPEDRREAIADWLATKDCTTCWRAAQGLPPATKWVESKEDWIAARRAEEHDAAAQWAETADMPALDGRSARAVDWATRVRHESMTALYTWAVQEGHAPEDYDAVESTAKTIDQAGWWLDHRDLAEADLLAALREAAEAGTTCENTY